MEFAPDIPDPQQRESSTTILVIDDNPALLQTAQALFSASGWRCLTRQDTVSALCAIVEHKPAAVLLDCDAGPLDAWKCCLLIKEHPDYKKVRVILVGRQDNMLVRARAAAAAADGFLPKPFSAEEVLRLLQVDTGLAA